MPLFPWLVMAATAAAQPARLLPAGTSISTLDNGLQVVIVPLDSPGLAAVQVWMDVGARDETEPGTTGYAHFFEHLMFHGSEAVPREERQARLLRLAVVDNAWTSEDHTVYVSAGPVTSLPALLELEADRFSRLHLDPDAVKREAGAVQGELRKSQASPSNALWNALQATAFSTHTYGHPVIGFDDDVAGMQDGFGAVSRFFATHYAPANATVVIAGDVDPAVTLAQVQDTLGRWAPEPGPPRATAALEPPQQGERHVRVPWSRGAVSPRVALAWKVPAFVPGETSAAARVLMAELLGSRVSPLHRRLVDEEKLATSLYVPEPTSRSPGLFVVWADLLPKADPARVAHIIREEAANLAAQGVGDDAPVAPEVRDRVQLARDRARRTALLELSDPASWASAIGQLTSYRGKPRDLSRHVTALSQVEAETVQQVAAQTFIDSSLTVGILASPEVLDALPPPPAPPTEEAE